MRTRSEQIALLSRGHKKFLVGLEKIREKFVSSLLSYDEVWEMKMEADKNDERPILTGIEFWDDLVGPLRRGNLYVLCGYAGVGKTTLSVQIAWAIAEKKRNVWLYCLEMTAPEVLEILVGHITKNAEPREKEYALASAQAAESGFRLFDSSMRFRKWDEHLQNIVIETKKNNIEFLVIDNFHYLTRVEKNPFEVEGIVSQRLKSLSQELNIPILLLHHLKKPEGVVNQLEPEPTVHAMRGATALLNDASTVLILHHPLAKSSTPDYEGARQSVGKLTNAKARWGRGGAAYVRLFGSERTYYPATMTEYLPKRAAKGAASFSSREES